MFSTWLEAQLGLAGRDDDKEIGEEPEMLNKIRKCSCLLHGWDILKSNILWTIWVERCQVVMRGTINHSTLLF